MPADPAHDDRAPASRSRYPKVNLTQVADPGRLAEIWKRMVRKRLKEVRLPDFELAHDPLEYLHIDWDINHLTKQLAQDLHSGRYRASPPEIVRCAKRHGLTRPLAFLSPVDQIVYKSVVLFAEPQLLANSKPWTRYGRAEVRSRGDTSPAESAGWFVAWMHRQRQLGNVVGDSEWVMETDVANFYPGVQLQGLLAHVLAHSDLDEKVVRLLGQMLRVFASSPDYRDSATIGLPQENFECSRILAHTYLYEVDEAFSAEGEAGLYSRWVDDIVIGAHTEAEGLMHVSRAQAALERMGLYPNASKTRVVRRTEFEEGLLHHENAYLDLVEFRLKHRQVVDREAFRKRMGRHLRQINKGTSWIRVLRRYYTASRHLRDQTLIHHAPAHLIAFPDSSRQIFEYVMNFRLTPTRVRRMFDSVEACAGLYQDVDLLVHEYLCLAPNLDQLALRSLIADWSLGIVARSVSANPRLAAASATSLGKFGTREHLMRLRTIWERSGQQTAFYLQGLIILKGAGLLTRWETETALRKLGADPHGTFLRAIVDGDAGAVSVGLSEVVPRERRDPTRYAIKVRAALLSPWLLEADPGKWNAASVGWRKRLQKTPQSLVDNASERLVFGV